MEWIYPLLLLTLMTIAAWGPETTIVGDASKLRRQRRNWIKSKRVPK